MTISRPCRSLTAGRRHRARSSARCGVGSAGSGLRLDGRRPFRLAVRSGAVTGLLLGGVDHALGASALRLYVSRASRQAGNVVANGSFESGSGLPAPGRGRTTIRAPGVLQFRHPSQGNRSMRVNVPGPTDSVARSALSADFRSVPIHRIAFSCRMRTEALSTQLNLHLVEQDAAGNLVQRGLGSDSGTNDWATRRLTFVTGPAAVSAFIKVEIYSGHGRAWVDEIQLLDVFAGRDPVPSEPRRYPPMGASCRRRPPTASR